MKTVKHTTFLLDDGAPAPTSAEVRAGTASGGGAALQSGSINLTANTESTATISGLEASTNYDTYVVAENTVPNLQETPTLMEVNTTFLDTIPPMVTSTDPSDGGLLTAKTKPAKPKALPAVILERTSTRPNWQTPLLGTCSWVYRTTGTSRQG